MIYTVTLNPALDYNLSIENLKLGTLNLSNNGYFLGGGKGINVSKVLKNFGIDSIVLGFIGGFTGEFIKNELNHKNIQNKFIEIDGNTRLNIKMKNIEEETEIAGISPIISKENFEKFIDRFKNIQEKDILVLSGSIPESLSSTIYKDIIQILPKSVKIILDTRGEGLIETLKEKVFLVKPNIHELEEYSNKKLTNISEVIQVAKDIQNKSANYVIVSMGKEGSILIGKEGSYRGNVPVGTLKNSVGSGDSMVAGLVAKIAQGKDIFTAYKYGIGSGSATAFSHDLCTSKQVEDLLEQIEIVKI